MKVDVKEVLRSKSPALARWVPGFVVDYLRRIVHEQQVNSFLTDFAGMSPVEFTRASLGRMNITSEAVGLDAIDPAGRYIFASNHPFGGLDGLMLADHIERRFGDVRVVVNDILMNLEPLKDMFIPINKHGRQSSDHARAYNDAFDSDIPIVTFPAGLVSRRKKGVVEDLTWRSNFIKRAVSSGRDIVPVYFEGELSPFFYNLSNLRTMLGIKANIEMLYLADEMFRQSGQHFRIVFGEPIPCHSLRAGKDAATSAGEIRIKAYNLKKRL